jgi:hypothetical protein
VVSEGIGVVLNENVTTRFYKSLAVRIIRLNRFDNSILAKLRRRLVVG